MTHEDKAEALTVLALLGFLKTECEKYTQPEDLQASMQTVLAMALYAVETEPDFSVIGHLTYLKPIEHDGVDLRMIAVMEISTGANE